MAKEYLTIEKIQYIVSDLNQIMVVYQLVANRRYFT